MKKVLTMAELATTLGISERQVYRLAKSGEILGVPIIRIGRKMVVSKAQVDRVLDGELVSATQS